MEKTNGRADDTAAKCNCECHYDSEGTGESCAHCVAAAPIHVEDAPTVPDATRVPMTAIVAERERAWRAADRYPTSGLGEDDRGKW